MEYIRDSQFASCGCFATCIPSKRGLTANPTHSKDVREELR